MHPVAATGGARLEGDVESNNALARSDPGHARTYACRQFPVVLLC